MKYIIVIWLCLSFSILNAQSFSQFRGKLNIYASTGTAPNFTINGYFQDDDKFYSSDSILVNDIIYVPTLTRCAKVKITAITSKTGGIFIGTVQDLDAVLTAGFKGISGIVRPTTNRSFPVLPTGLPAKIEACMLTDFARMVDSITVGAITGVDLGYTPSPTNGIVTNDKGADATITLATGTNAGLMTPADFTKLALYPAYSLATFNYWTKVSTALEYTLGNVGIGVAPSTLGRLVTQGAGNTSSDFAFLARNAAGTNLMSIAGNNAVIIGSGTTSSLTLNIGGSTGTFSIGDFSIIKDAVNTAGQLHFSSAIRSLTIPYLSTQGFIFYPAAANSATNNGLLMSTGRSFSASSAIRINSTTTFNSGASTLNLAALQLSGGAVFDGSVGQNIINTTYAGVLADFTFAPSRPADSTQTTLRVFNAIPTINITGSGTHVRVPAMFYANPSVTATPAGLYGLESRIESGTNRKNLYIQGSAESYFNAGIIIASDTLATLGSNLLLDVEGRTGTQQLVGQGSALTTTVQSAAGTSATASSISAESSGLAGRFTITTGSGSVIAGNWVTFTFNTAYTNKPIVILQPDSSNSTTGGDNAAAIIASTSVVVTTTGFSVRVSDDPSALISTRFDFTYIVIGGK